MVRITKRENLVFFKAQGTFRGSKPTSNSPYPTATPFFSQAILGQQIWPEGTSLDYLHQRLSSSLNDRHNRIGIIGDWMETHDPQYGGFWSYLYETFTRITYSDGTKEMTNIHSTQRES